MSNLHGAADPAAPKRLRDIEANLSENSLQLEEQSHAITTSFLLFLVDATKRYWDKQRRET